MSEVNCDRRRLLFLRPIREAQVRPRSDELATNCSKESLRDIERYKSVEMMKKGATKCSYSL